MEPGALDIVNLKYSLFFKRRFLPIFLATFLGAFNDNLLRSGLVVMIAYSATMDIALPAPPSILVTICSALLVMPMLLFSSVAGSMADKFEKSRLVVWTKIIETMIMMAAFYGFAHHNIYLLMALLFVSGTHTTFYSPIKFSILPDHLKSGELLAGNGFMAGGSYLAIILGLIAGGLLVELPENAIGFAAVGIALVGLFASLLVLPSHAAHAEATIELNVIKGTSGMLRYVWDDRRMFLIIVALSWFMMFSSVYMSQFANYAQGVVKADNEVYILFLTLFSVGIALGSLLCDTLLKGEISPKLTPIAGFGTSLFTYLMVFTTPKPGHHGMLDVLTFVTSPHLWPMLGCMVMVAVCGGIYIVPLYALLQSRATAQYRSRVIAASNWSDSVFITLAAIASALLLMVGFGIQDLFTLLATLNLVVAWYVRKLST